jgi:tetratricopeptide (TPR) repeat protein
MAKKKKISRKQLLKEPDEILTTTARIFQFAVRYRYPLLGALGGLILIVVVISAVRYHAIARENDSFAGLQTAWQNYRQQAQNTDPQTAYQSVESEFEALLDRFGGVRGGKFATLVFADISFEAGRIDRALELYQQALEDLEVPEIRNRIHNAMGYAYEAKGDLPAAVRQFEQVLGGSAAAFQEEARYNLGRLYADLGKPRESRTAYETLLAENPNTMYAGMIREQLATNLSVDAAASPPQAPGN